jgi:hypothetical protein
VVASRRAPPDRLLQPNTTRDHDRWIDRTSRTPAAVARDESCFSHTSREGGSGVRVAVLRGTASRGFTGQGRPSGFHPRLRRLPLRSLASESFAPTRSTRTPPVAARDAIGWKTPAARRRNEAPGSRARQVQAALRPAPPHTRLELPGACGEEGRLTHSPAKGSTIRRTRGAFRRRTSPGEDGSVVHMLSPACGVPVPAPLRSSEGSTPWTRGAISEDSTTLDADSRASTGEAAAPPDDFCVRFDPRPDVPQNFRGRSLNFGPLMQTKTRRIQAKYCPHAVHTFRTESPQFAANLPTCRQARDGDGRRRCRQSCRHTIMTRARVSRSDGPSHADGAFPTSSGHAPMGPRLHPCAAMEYASTSR